MGHCRAKGEHDSRERVLDAAIAVVLRGEYDASMDRVADEAGVAKQTIYAHFESKDALFHAAVLALVGPAQEAISCGEEGIAPTLQALAEAYQEARKRSGVCLGRVLMSEAPRSLPAVRELLHGTVAGMTRNLTGCMARTMERGHMRRDDPHVAAELFLAMLQGIEGDSELFARAVTLFKQAYDIKQPHVRLPGHG